MNSKGRGRETLKQRVARTIAEDISINTIAGTEHTEWVDPESFLGSIAPFANDKEEGAREAEKYINGPEKLSFWTDGYKLNPGANK